MTSGRESQEGQKSNCTYLIIKAEIKKNISNLTLIDTNVTSNMTSR